jgi:hypothetical protein
MMEQAITTHVSHSDPQTYVHTLTQRRDVKKVAGKWRMGLEEVRNRPFKQIVNTVFAILWAILLLTTLRGGGGGGESLQGGNYAKALTEEEENKKQVACNIAHHWGDSTSSSDYFLPCRCCAVAPSVHLLHRFTAALLSSSSYWGDITGGLLHSQLCSGLPTDSRCLFGPGAMKPLLSVGWSIVPINSPLTPTPPPQSSDRD